MPEMGKYIFSETEDKELLTILRRLFEMSLRDQFGRRKRWRRNEQLIAGEHYAIYPNYPDDKSKILFNACHDIVETIMPILTDLIPEPEVEPRPKKMKAGSPVKELMEKAESLAFGIEDQWDEFNIDENWVMALKSSLIYGNGPMFFYDDDGELIVDNIDIFAWFLAPNSTHINRARWIMTAEPTPLSSIAATYGNDALLGLKTEGKLDKFRTFQLVNQSEDETGTPHSVTHARPELDGDDSFVEIEDRERVSHEEVLLIDCWFAIDVRNMGDLDKLGKEKSESDFKALETYQHITFASNKILDFQETTDYKIGEPPFVDIVNYPQPNSAWGSGEPDQIETMNLGINILMSEATDAAIMSGNPPIKASQDVINANPDGIVLKAGKVIIMPTPASVLKWMESWAMPSYMQTLPTMFIGMIDKISGVGNTSRGQREGQVTAASAIQKLQDAAESRIRFKVKQSMRGPIKHAFFLIANFIINNIDDVRSRISRDKQTGNRILRTFTGKGLNIDDFRIKAGKPLFENKSDWVNLILQLQPFLGVLPEEMVQLMPPEIRDVIMSIRSEMQGAGPRAGIDMNQLSDEEKQILNTGSEDEIAKLLAILQQRGASNPPSDSNGQAVTEHGTAAKLNTP